MGRNRALTTDQKPNVHSGTHTGQIHTLKRPAASSVDLWPIDGAARHRRLMQRSAGATYVTLDSRLTASARNAAYSTDFAPLGGSGSSSVT